MVKLGANEKRSFGKKILKFLFGHVGLMLLVVAYAVVGAYILIEIEKGDESKRILQKKVAAKNIADTKKYIIDHSLYQSSLNHTEEEYKFRVKQNLDLFLRYVIESAQNNYYDGRPDSWNYDWTFAKSLLFTVTTMGAIGFGHIAPRTSAGQLFSIYYGMIGIPLLLLFLANIGDFLAKSFKYIYSRLCCRWCRIRRKVSELDGPDKMKKRMLWKEEVGKEEYMPTENINVPIIINLCVIAVYLILGSALFSAWEQWEMHQAAYFTFITLTTIGFGDYVPGNTFSSGGDQAFISSLKMIVTMCFLLFGMALVSMAINLMQQQMIQKAKWLASEVGIGSDGKQKSDLQVNVKKSDPNKVISTPYDKDGNQLSSGKDRIKIADVEEVKITEK